MPDERVHQLGFNADRARRHERHEVHQWLTPSTIMNGPRRRSGGTTVLDTEARPPGEPKPRTRGARPRRESRPPTAVRGRTNDRRVPRLLETGEIGRAHV